jgi:hypothetical protein
MNSFILYDDFKAIATEEDLEVLTSGNDLTIKQCNQIAIDEAAGYLNTRYDVLSLFRDPIEYNVANANTEGDRVYTITQPVEEDVYTHYLCIQDAPAGTLITNTDYFTEGDSRDQKLLEVTMSMSLFYIHKRLTPNNIPAFRQLYYDGSTADGESDKNIMSAIKWLTDIQSGQLNPWNWPVNEDEEVPPVFDEPYEMIGNDPSKGMMWGNDMGTEYFHYGNLRDKNIIINTDDEA